MYVKNRKLFYVLIAIFLLTITVAGILHCISKPDIEFVKAWYEPSLRNIPGVVGVGIGESNKKPCIKVYLEKETPQSKYIPKKLGGYRVKVEIISPLEVLGEVKIKADRDIYSPFMSSTVGIGLTSEYTLNTYPATLRFRWSTNYGYFLSWGPKDFKVYLLGNEVVNQGEKIYWSYDPEETNIDKPLPLIFLSLEDAQTGLPLALATLKIDWEDQSTAKVKK